MTIDEVQTDDALAQRMRRGDHRAFAALTSRHWNAVHRLGRNLLPDPARAGKLAEATFLKALDSPEAFPSGVPFRTSLYRVAIGKALDEVHSHPGSLDQLLAAFLPRFNAEGDFAVDGTDWSRRNQSDFEPARVEERIRETLRRLEPLDRAAFVLQEIERLPPEEVAAILRMPPRHVAQRAHRAAMILTGSLGQLFAGGITATTGRS
jgi:RNA polymerase sigma-70 factor (ECF subfamily)